MASESHDEGIVFFFLKGVGGEGEGFDGIREGWFLRIKEECET